MEQNLLEQAPGLPMLLAQLQAAQEKRLSTPTSQCVGLALHSVTLSDAECVGIDTAHHDWKQNGGPVREHDARAVAIERGSRKFT